MLLQGEEKNNINDAFDSVPCSSQWQCTGAAGSWAQALPPFAGASKEAIEKLRYRAEDVARSLNPTIVKQVMLSKCLKVQANIIWPLRILTLL